MRKLLPLFAALCSLSCPDAHRGTVLTISGSAVGKEGEILARQVGRFERAHPGVSVRIQPAPDDATQRHQLYVQWLNAHVGSPDVLQIDVIWTAEFAAAGWLLPLDRFHPDVAGFFPATIEASRWRGTLYALPWFADVGMLYWRTDLMTHAPRSLDEMNEAAISAMRRGIAHGVVWQGARYEGLVTVFAEILGAFGGAIMTPEGRVVVNSDSGVGALTFLRDQVRSGITPREVLTWHEEECRFAFQNGAAAFMRNWPYATTPMNGPDSRVAGRFSVAPIPAAAGGHATATLGGAQLAINHWSHHPDAAYRLAAFLTAPAQMLERARVAGEFPARRSLFASAELASAIALDPAAVRAIIAAATPRPVTPIYAELSEELQIGLHRALTGEESPRSALDAAAARMQRLVDENGLR